MIRPKCGIVTFALILSLLQSDATAEIAVDKEEHMLVGTAIYGICIGFGYLSGTEDWFNYKTCLIPVGIIALDKERYDKKGHGTPEWADVRATVAIPVIIAGVTYIVYEW